MDSSQFHLFDHSPYRSEGAEGLPLITEANTGSVLVHTPGHLYKPSPIEVDGVGKASGPGALIPTEREFVSRLIRHLSPDFATDSDVQQRVPSALKQGRKEFFLLRNLDRSPDATRLRMGAEDWFYPDFIFWVLDRECSPEHQTVAYIDPKGLAMGLRGGWNNHKVLCFIYKLVEIAQQIKRPHDERGEVVQFAMKGVFVSTTRKEYLEEVSRGTQEFHVYDDRGIKYFPSYEDFARAGIFFAERPDHIERMMAYLEGGPTLLNDLMGRIANTINIARNALPEDEIGCFYRWQLLQNQGAVEPSLGEIIRLTLTALDGDHALRRLQQQARKELQPLIHKNLVHNLIGIVKDVNRIPDPCRVLLEHWIASDHAHS